MISFQDLMKGFGVVTVMNACIYKLTPGSSYIGTNGCVHGLNGRALTPFDFECTHLYLDTLKIANLVQEGPTKTITGGQYSNPLIKYGKTMTLEMQNALGSAAVLEEFFGCDYDAENGVLSIGDKFPGAFAIEGETFFIDQKTGQKKKVWIFIPQFIPDGILNLTQDAEGDAAVFDCNGSVCVTRIKDAAHPDGHDIFYHISDKPWLRFGYMINTNLKYVLNDDQNTWSIDGLTVDAYDGDIIIPALHEGKRVTKIAARAFDKTNNNNINIHNVYIPSSVITIADAAFADQDSLIKIVFSGNESNLRFIFDEAFENTTSLKMLSLPPKVRYIGQNAFKNSAIVSKDGIYTYVDNWLVGTNEESTETTYSAFKENIVGVADLAIPELEDDIELLPLSVIYVGKQDIGCVLKEDYIVAGNYICGYLRRFAWEEESFDNYMPSYSKYALVFYSGQYFNNEIYTALVVTEALYTYTSTTVFSGIGAEEIGHFIIPSNHILNPNTFSFIYGNNTVITITYQKTKQMAIEEGAPWGLDNIQLTGPYRVEVTINYADGQSDTYIKDDTGQT